MKDTVELVFILDRSGSMAGLEQDTIGGFNSLIEKQKNKKGSNAIVSLVLFNHTSEVIYNRVPLSEVKSLTLSDFVVGGSTALLDTIGGSINRVKRTHDLLGEKDSPNKVIYVITTDGQENASRYFSKRKIKDMVLRNEEEGWEFIFLGSNIDSFQAAHNYGFRYERVSNYRNNREGVRDLYSSLDRVISDVRSNREIRDNWNENLKEDKDNTKKSKLSTTDKINIS